MNITIANRACSIIYSLVKRTNPGVWLLPVNVCPDVPLTFCEANVDFEFVDIDPDTLCMDESKVLEKITDNKTKYAGIIFVRTYAYVYDTVDFFRKCRAVCPDVFIVDDRCLCIPDLDPINYGADLILFSTGHCKQIDLGGGGFCISSFDVILDKNTKYKGVDEESIYKLSYATGEPLVEIPQGWLDVQPHSILKENYFEEIERSVENRREYRSRINLLYSLNLPKEIQYSSHFQDWRFNIKIPMLLKSVLLQSLFENGLFASNHYHSANKLFDRDDFPVSEHVFDTTINLFNDFHYTDDMALKTCEIIRGVIKKY